MSLYEFDDSMRTHGIGLIAGIDEAGRGPLAGPVVAAAVILPAKARIDGLRDSKRVPERERDQLYNEILHTATDIGVGAVDAVTIDRFNILVATRMAMEMAVMDLVEIPDLLLIDALILPSLKLEQKAVIKGDAKSASIAAASIVAKVVRDRIMRLCGSRFPSYGFEKHKGYGTKDHIDSINRLGPCCIHRKSFRPVEELSLPFPPDEKRPVNTAVERKAGPGHG